MPPPTQNPTARLKHPVDADHDPDSRIESWHADSRDFIDVAWALRRKGVLAPETNAQDVSEAFRGSEAVQAHALLHAVRLLLDPERLQTVLDGIDDLIPYAIDRARQQGQPHFASTHLTAAVATLIRDTPTSPDHYKTLDARVDAVREHQ